MSISRRQFVAASAAGIAGLHLEHAAADSRVAVQGAGLPIWQQFKGDARRTGRSNLLGPLKPKPLGNPPNNPPIQSPMCVDAGGSAYLAGDSGVLFAYGPFGGMRWKQLVADSYVTAGTAVLNDGSILAVPESGLVTCYSPDGVPLWTFDLGDYSGPDSGPLIGKNGSIYLGNKTGLYALRPDGKLKWLLQQVVEGPPAQAPDGTIYFPSGGNLVAVWSSGKLRWSYPSDLSFGLGSAPVVGDDGTIYITSIRGQLLAVSPDGKRRWIWGDEGLVSDVPSSPAIGADGVIYFGSSYSYFNAVNPDGSTKWSRLTVNNDSYSAPAIGADGSIYFGAATGKVHAFSPDGEQIWERYIGEPHFAHYVRSEPIVLPGRRLLVGAFAGVFVLGD